ncbi:hypothetical protein [Actinacidiphila glaucinigra]|uniref:hypothetical protein n=1 Tax=Actinacidiphila glaucinigra TaxID=235986 RepID=UPI0029A6B308|nr:hypothetical protein [Streptomyces sp. PA03-3a]
MPAYLVRHRGGQSGDIRITDPALTLTLEGDWAVSADNSGPVMVIPAELTASIERLDPDDAPDQPDAGPPS